MKTILVLGGTGAMGKYLVQFLAEQGYKVSVTTRSFRQSSTNIEYIQGDAKDDGFLTQLLARKWDALVDFMLYTTPDFEQWTTKLLAATDQYIFLSSARVYANSTKPIEENSPRLLDSSADSEFLATDEYALAKARQENILGQSGSTNWTIIRPYITYSEQRLQLGVFEKEGWLYRALKGRTIVFSKDIMTRLTTLSYGRDVASAIAALVGDARALGETYDITQREAASWREVLDVYLDVLEKHLSKRPSVLLLDYDDFSRCKGSEYQTKYDRSYDRVFASSKISEFVETGAFVPLEQGLTCCLEEFLDSPQFFDIDWRSEAIKDRYSGEVASLAEPSHWKQKLRYIVYRFVKT